MENPSSEMLTFYLSQEELFTSLAYLRLPGILGLDGSVFDQLTPEQTRLSIGIAERALIARCFLTVQPNEQQLQPAPILLAALLTCARPQHTLIVTRHRPDQTFNYFFHTVNENTIFHTQNFPGVHQFIRLTPQQIAANLFHILSLANVPHLTCQPEKIPAQSLAHVQAAVRAGNGHNPWGDLDGNDLNHETGSALAYSLTHLVANTTLVAIQHLTPDHATSQGFTLLHGENGLWLLRPLEEPDQELVSATPIRSDEAEAEIQKLLP